MSHRSNIVVSLLRAGTRCALACIIVACANAGVTPVKSANLKPGLPWPDNNGVPINAHGGGVVFFQNRLDSLSE